MATNTRATSSCDNTTGSRRGRFARTTSSIQGSSISNTTRQRNSNADNAWFCVAAATLPCVASRARNASTSFTPNSSVGKDEAPDPPDVGLLDTDAVMTQPDPLANLG